MSANLIKAGDAYSSPKEISHKLLNSHYNA